MNAGIRLLRVLRVARALYILNGYVIGCPMKQAQNSDFKTHVEKWKTTFKREIRQKSLKYLFLETPCQSIARGLFQLSRRDREFLPFSLMLRDEIENFFLSVSCFETRSRISSFQSHASRRDREFLSLGLVLRDENENLILQSHVSRRERDFFSSVSCFETRTRMRGWSNARRWLR